MIAVSFRKSPTRDDAGLVVPVAEGAAVPELGRAAAEAAGFRGLAGKVLDLPGPPRAVLLGLGQPASLLEFEAAGATAARLFAKAAQVVLDGRGWSPAQAAALAAGFALGAWRFDRYRTRDVPKGPARLTVLVDAPSAARAAWTAQGAAVAGCLMARDLVTEPANVLTTRDFAALLQALRAEGLGVEVWGRERLRRAGFGALLAVGGGSATPPRLVVLRWPGVGRGRRKQPPVVFVGKGLVFDTGGISIKGAAGMEDMRADMAGAAACVGAMLALARRDSPCPAVAVLAIAENATGAESYRPGDVLTTASGRTVEVIDTDAEGRLVLADALHHAVTAFRPRAVIDLATLTGSIVTALGHHRAGLFGNDPALAARLQAAGDAVGEALWPMPIGARHREDLHSDIADIKQCMPAGTGRPQPDACHAAAFLRDFVGDVPWAHLDIAGVEAQAKPHALGPAGATGFGVRLLDRLVAGFEDAG